ncbi:MAG: endonuclease III [Candidatus Pacearchaeota archaeon]|jgi:endonuclease-3
MVKEKLAIKQLNELKKRIIAKRLAADGWNSEYKTLISILMSARTRDETTIKIAKILFKKYPSAKSLAKAKLPDVERIIKPVNFYRNKSKNIINCAKQIASEYNGNIPHEFDRLIKLSGVGRKTANVFLAVYGHDAIGVDTHLAYCSRRLGWSKNINPKDIEQDLKKLFPKTYWRRLNWIVVSFGQTYRSRKEKNKILDKIKRI